ncbi:Epimerase domain-containing protein [Citrus sinensis]|uniref:Epimerase domain-containing protein n=1 Tax=Citrus sinensis TaxID=2711 RepID=A0ACB8K6B8_CITSI|nr:Epimerase domain-containing protein [Citrus sinensis]
MKLLGPTLTFASLTRYIWYSMSKTLAEKAAWEFAEKNGTDVVAIHPATSLGPFPQPYVNASGAVLQRLLQAVHVKDVAKAQVLLFETPAASGRYLCTNGIYQFAEFAEKVSKLFPEYPIHMFKGETQPGLVACENAAKRLISLGLDFTPVEETIREAVESLKAQGHLG